MADGGYYAIKGFAFQLDKAILTLLNNTDENKEISIEQIQDINDNDFVMQVKYKETQDYSDIAIREPIIQLVEEFNRNATHEYKLYCHFRDKNELEERIDIKRLNSILSLSTGKSKEALSLNKRINAIDPILRDRFKDSFKLVYAPNYDAQFAQILFKLQSFSFVGKANDDIAILYYSNLIDFLKRIVINNPNPKNRILTKKQAIDYLRNGKRLIFNSSFQEFKGKQAFFSFVKSCFVKTKRNQKNLIVFGEVEIDNSVSLSKLIIDITDRYFKNAMYDIEPLTFILPDNNLLDIKKDLINNSILFNDGYEGVHFSEDIFHLPVIKTRKPIGNKASDNLDKISFKLRILSKTHFSNITNHKHYQMIYYFDLDIINSLCSSSFHKIDSFNTKQIHDVFTF